MSSPNIFLSKADAAYAEVRQRMRTPILVDGRNYLDPGAAREAGLLYDGIGRGGA